MWNHGRLYMEPFLDIVWNIDLPTFLCDHTRMPSNTIYDLSGAHLMVFLPRKIVFLLQERAQTPGEWIICPAYHHQSGILLDHAWSFDKPGPSGQHQHHMSQEGIFLGDDVFSRLLLSNTVLTTQRFTITTNTTITYSHYGRILLPLHPPNTVMLLDYNGDDMTKTMMWKWKDFCWILPLATEVSSPEGRSLRKLLQRGFHCT